MVPTLHPPCAHIVLYLVSWLLRLPYSKSYEAHKTHKIPIPLPQASPHPPTHCPTANHNFTQIHTQGVKLVARAQSQAPNTTVTDFRLPHTQCAAQAHTQCKDTVPTARSPSLYIPIHNGAVMQSLSHSRCWNTQQQALHSITQRQCYHHIQSQSHTTKTVTISISHTQTISSRQLPSGTKGTACRPAPDTKGRDPDSSP